MIQLHRRRVVPHDEQPRDDGDGVSAASEHEEVGQGDAGSDGDDRNPQRPLEDLRVDPVVQGLLADYRPEVGN